MSVETYAGQGAYGPAYSAAVSVSCSVDATRKMVRDSEGRETVSELTLFVHPDDSEYFTPESRVTYSSRTSTVLSATPQSFRGQVVLVRVSCS